MQVLTRDSGVLPQARIEPIVDLYYFINHGVVYRGSTWVQISARLP